MIKKTLILFLLITYHLSLITSIVSAQTPPQPTPVDYQLPYPGILPDHPLYSVKRLRDWLLIVFTRQPVKKVELYLLFSDKKIGMSTFLLEKRKVDLAVNTLVESQHDLLKAAGFLPSLSRDNYLPEGLRDKIELASRKHLEIASAILDMVSDLKRQEKINQALKLNNQARAVTQSVK